MWSDYDEDLNQNLFFKEILLDHADILQKASEESWIICIPRLGTLEKEDVAIDTILDHILVPSCEKGYCTLSKKALLNVRDKTIEDKPGDSVRIHFEETFYIGGSKYSVWCLDRPLFANRSFCDAHKPNALETLSDCIDFLWSENLGGTLEGVRGLCWSFIERNPEFALEDLQSQKDLIGSLYSQCLQVVLKQCGTVSGGAYVENLKVAVETFMQSCLERTLVDAVNTLTWRTDAHINKITRNSSDLQLKHLGIPTHYCDVITHAKCHLSRLNSYTTVLDKLHVIKTAVQQLYQHKIPEACLTSDDLLQIFVFLILKLNVNSWYGNLVYVTQFRFSSLDFSDRNGFAIATLEAAVEFVKKGRSLVGHVSSVSSDVASFTSDCNFSISESSISSLASKECHPLCSCETCRGVDEKGQNAVICASIGDRSDLVEHLLNDRRLDVNFRDYSGKSALHHACSKGHQAVLLILVNFKADVNARDDDGNTALHCCALNGHENCAKALLYTSRVDVNAANNQSDTPLILAAKWGYLALCRILLEYGANPALSNKKKQIAASFAANYYASKLLREPDFAKDSSNRSCTPVNVPNGIEEDRTHACAKEHGVKPKIHEQYKKLDLLLKAIENNDLPLSCFYLGFTSDSNVSTPTSSPKCHPLCDCPKCSACDEPMEAQNFHSRTIELNVNFCNGEGMTPLHVAAKWGRKEIVRVLLDSQASINLKTYKHLQTPLHLACVNQTLAVVRELLTSGGCIVDSRDSMGHTPLYYAALGNDLRIVEVLLSNGADPEARNFKGRSVLKEVQDRGIFGVLKMLNEARTSGNVCDSDSDLFL